ncbi:hypothetical protein ACS0TY_008430 [Phlomoides rotata]
MELNKFHILGLVVLVYCVPVVHGWVIDGQTIIRKLAQSRLSKAAEDGVSQLLPPYAKNDLSTLSTWADGVKTQYPWSRALHYVYTPDKLCTYNYTRDCKDEEGVKDRCVAGAINNYTTQLLTYHKSSPNSYNLTEALLFLSHFIANIHQPLNIGFTSDKGGKYINVYWFTVKETLYDVWNGDIVATAEQNIYHFSMDEVVDALQENITTVWSDQVKAWEACSTTACPDQYASEGIKAACEWAYKGVHQDSVLEDAYFESRSPVVYLRLAQAGVRLAAILNRIFEP